MVSKASHQESDQEVGERFEILRNDPYDENSDVNLHWRLWHNKPPGQQIEKIMHVKSKFPKFIAMLVPDSMTDIIEHS